MPSVREIRRSLGVPDMVRLSAEGTAPEEASTDLDRAMNFRDRTFGQRVMRNTERQVEAEGKAAAATAELEEAEAGLKLKETQFRIREIEEHLRATAGNAGDSTLSQVVAILQEDRRMSMAQQEETRGQMMEMLQGQVEDLRNQLLQRVTEASNGHRPPSLGEQVQEAKNLLDTIQSLAPAAPNDKLAGMGRSVEEVIRLHELQEAHEDRQAQRAEDHEVRMASLRMERERFDDERLERKGKLEEDKRRGTALSNTLERALPYAQQFVQDVGQRMVGGEAAAPQRESPAAAFGPDTRVAPCPSCKVFIPFPLGQDISTCPGCGMVCSLQLEPEPVAPPEERPVPAPTPAPAAETAGELTPEEVEAQEPVHAV